MTRTKTRAPTLATALVLAASPLAAAEYTLPIVQSLTGPAAFVGVPFTEGMKMALDEANESGGFGEGVTINYEVEDDGLDRAQTIASVRRHAADPNVVMFAGPTSGYVGIVAGTVANELQLPLMTVTNAEEARETGPYTFMTAQTGPQVIPRVADYAVEKVGVETCQIVGVTDNEAYVTQAADFIENVTAAGVASLDKIGLKGDETDFSAIALRVINEGADCLFVSAPAAMSANIVTQLKQNGLSPDTQIFGMSAFASPELVRIGGAAVEGVIFIGDWVPGGSNELGKEFVAKFTEMTGNEPTNWEAMGYSAGLVIADVFSRAGPDITRESIQQAFMETKDVPVVVGDGTFSYDEERYPVFGINVMTIKDGEFVLAE